MSLSLTGWARLLFSLALMLSPILVVGATPATASAQEPDDIPLLLGEYVQRELAADEVVTFSIYVPEDSLYMVSADDEAAAEVFDIAVFTEEEDIFEGALLDATELELNEGTHFLEITAVEDGVLSFFVLGMIGDMSDSSRQPGKLYPGSFYTEDSVSTDRYATLSVPDLGYPQQVLIYVEAGDDDTVTVYAEGDDIGYRYLYSNEGPLLSFWSEGGEYLITVEPWERRSEFSLIVFLSGAPMAIGVGESYEATLVQGIDQLVYALELDTYYEEVIVELTSNAEEETPEVRVVDQLYDGELTFYSYDEDGVQVVEMENLFPGTYYMTVFRYSTGEEVDFTLSVSGEEGEPLTRLEGGVSGEGELTSGESHFYEFEVGQAGALVTVDLVSDAEDADFDLSVGANLQNLQWSSASIGANEQVQFIAPSAGTYYIQVESYSGEGAYEVFFEEGDLAVELVPGEVLEGSVDHNGSTVYRLVVDKPGQVLWVLLVGSAGTDLDLAVTLYSDTGEWLNSMSSSSLGSAEIVSQAAAQVGVYEVKVSAYGAGDDFRLLARLDSPEAILGAASSGE